MIVLDTTVLVYAVGAEHPLRRPCQQLVEAVRDARVSATTTVEAVQEFAHVRSRRRPRHDATDLAADYASLLRPLLVIDDEDLRAGLRLFRESEVLGAFDAVLAAAALRRDVTALVSADRAFDHVDDLPYADPADGDLAGRLGLR
jgi:predicted nucleic acid-binding protein